MKKSFLLITLIAWLISAHLLLVNSDCAAANKPIDLNFKNTDIKDVLRILAEHEGVNLIVAAEIEGLITIRLHKLNFRDALKLIVKKHGLAYHYQNRVYQVYKPYQNFLQITYQNDLLTLTAKEVLLAKLIQELNQKCNLNIVLDPDLAKERLSMAFKETPVTEGLEIILNQVNCEQVKNNSVTFIKKRALVEKPFSVIYKNGLLSIDAQQVPIDILARRITEKTGFSVVADHQLQKKVSLFFQNLPLGEGLKILGETNQLQVVHTEKIWRISAQRSGSLRVSFVNNLLSVNAEKTEYLVLIREINRQTGANIVADQQIRGSITINFQNLPLTEGLNLLFEARGLVVEKRKQAYYVYQNKTRNNKNITITYNAEKRTFNLDIQAAPLAHVLSEMARRANLNLVILSQVNWTINQVRLREMKFEAVLNYLLKGTVFTYKYDQGTYLIGEGMITRPENANFAIVKVYPIKYLKATELLKTLPPIFNRSNFMQLPGKNSLVVSAPWTIHRQFSSYLKEIDNQTSNTRVEIFKIKHMKAQDILKLFPPSIPKNDIVAVKETNSLVVTGPQNLINQVKIYLEKVDQVNPMIVFDIMVVSLTNSSSLDWDPAKGINSVVGFADGKHLNISPSTGDLTLKSVAGSASDVLAAVKLLVTKGQAKILQNPTISTLNGYKVSFNVATKKSYKISTTTGTGENMTITESVKTFDTGLFINITPWVAANNEITMEIKPKFSEYGGDTSDGLPSTIERSTESTIRVADGQTVIISGLKNTRKVKTVQKIPLLGDIPLIGFIFKKVRYEDSQDEFLVVITPYLVYDTAAKKEVDQKTQQDLKNKLSKTLLK